VGFQPVSDQTDDVSRGRVVAFPGGVIREPFLCIGQKTKGFNTTENFICWVHDDILLSLVEFFFEALRRDGGHVHGHCRQDCLYLLPCTDEPDAPDPEMEELTLTCSRCTHFVDLDSFGVLP
jgi:hypothetical protein